MSAARENERDNDDGPSFLSKDSIETMFDPQKVQESIAESTMRDLSLGVRPLPVPPEDFEPRPEAARCDYCNIPESADIKLLECGKCHFAKYCSPDCQLVHWKESHKSVCKQLSAEKEEQAKRIVGEMTYKPGDHTGHVTASLEVLSEDDAIFTIASSKYKLYQAIETLFIMEAQGYMQTVDEHLQVVTSWTQFLTTTLFKGDRANKDRFYCICPIRSREYIISSLTAWDSWMDAALYLVRSLKQPKFASLQNRRDLRIAQQLALVHRSARDVLVSLDLALIHKSVAKAVFFGSKYGTFKRSPEEAQEHAMQMCKKLRAMFCNGGAGFAGEDIDRNQTVEANVFHFAAILSYWYRELDVNPNDNGELFRQELNLSAHQRMMYETLAVPLAEGSVELGRSLTSEELKVRSQEAARKANGKKSSKVTRGKKGKGKNRKR